MVYEISNLERPSGTLLYKRPNNFVELMGDNIGDGKLQLVNAWGDNIDYTLYIRKEKDKISWRPLPTGSRLFLEN